MKNNKFYTVRTDPKFNQIIIEKDKFNAANAHIHHPFLGSEQGLQKCGKVELVLWA
jgi:hypothetical protein